MNKKALIAMSGGVDSSVAAYLMKEKGFDCIGVTMKLFYNEEVGIPKDHSCCSIDDIDDARRIATLLGMPYYVLNFTDGFEENVIQNFIYAYEHGMTPNPCIDCNRFMKFNLLFDKARELGYEYVVTGHYSSIEYIEETGRYVLKKAADPSKDQSYVLYSLTQEQLAHTLFPLGGMNKTDARNIAERHGFINAHKHDSQDICFVQSGTYADFIEHFTGKTYPEGDFLDLEGNVLGRHKGIIRYTIGQRKGLGIASTEPYYVAAVDVQNNTVTLAREQDLYSSALEAGNLNLISVASIEGEMKIKAKVRYRQVEQPATVTQIAPDRIRVVFEAPQRAITKGQAVVLYDGDVVVGGATIDTIM